MKKLEEKRKNIEWNGNKKRKKWKTGRKQDDNSEKESWSMVKEEVKEDKVRGVERREKKEKVFKNIHEELIKKKKAAITIRLWRNVQSNEIGSSD